MAEYLFKFRDIKPYDQVGDQVLRRAININREEGIELEASDVAFGEAALSYICKTQVKATTLNRRSLSLGHLAA